MSGPRFQHLDDVPWEEVRKIDFGDRTASVRAKWLDFSPRFLSLLAEWDAGMMIHAHGHNSDHIVYVLEGDMTCGDVHCGPGTHITLDQGETFGPFIAGPNGVVLLEVMMGDPRSFAADEDGLARAARGQGREAGAQPEDRAARMARRHAGPDRDRTVRRRVGVAAPLPAQRPHRDRHRRRALHAGRARRTARVRRRDDERAPRRLPRLPAQSAPGRGLVPRGDGERVGGAVPVAAPAAPPALVAEEIAWLAARFPGRVGLGVASARSPPTSRSCTHRWTTSRRASPPRSKTLAGMLDGSAPQGLEGDAADPRPAPSTRYPS